MVVFILFYVQFFSEKFMSVVRPKSILWTISVRLHVVMNHIYIKCFEQSCSAVSVLGVGGILYFRSNGFQILVWVLSFPRLEMESLFARSLWEPTNPTLFMLTDVEKNIPVSREKYFKIS